MPCPTCGSSDADEIAPGYWECRAVRIVTTVEHLPDARFPGQLRPQQSQHVLRCATRFQAAGATGSEPNVNCECGTFAIGNCMECGKPTCGDCSTRAEGQRVCVAHVREAQAKAAIAQTEREAAILASKNRREADASAVPQRFVQAMKAAGSPGIRPFWPIVNELSGRAEKRAAKLISKDWAAYKKNDERACFRQLRGVTPMCQGWLIHEESFTTPAKHDQTSGQILATRLIPREQKIWWVLSQGNEWFRCADITYRRPMVAPATGTSRQPSIYVLAKALEQVAASHGVTFSADLRADPPETAGPLVIPR